MLFLYLLHICVQRACDRHSCAFPSHYCGGFYLCISVASCGGIYGRIKALLFWRGFPSFYIRLLTADTQTLCLPVSVLCSGFPGR